MSKWTVFSKTHFEKKTSEAALAQDLREHLHQKQLWIYLSKKLGIFRHQNVVSFLCFLNSVASLEADPVED